MLPELNAGEFEVTVCGVAVVSLLDHLMVLLTPITTVILLGLNAKSPVTPPIPIFTVEAPGAGVPQAGLALVELCKVLAEVEEELLVDVEDEVLVEDVVRLSVVLDEDEVGRVVEAVEVEDRTAEEVVVVGRVVEVGPFEDST
jgi:hypothetical protein